MPARAKRKQPGHQVWDGYDAGSGYAFAESVEGWSYELAYQVLSGQRLPEPLPRLTVTRLSPGKRPDAMATVGSGILVSSILKEVLEQWAGEHIQFVPVKIQRYPKARYSLVNLLAHVPRLDRARSKYETYDEPPHAIHTLRKLVLTTIAPDAPPIFRMAEIPGVILVRDDLREAMQAVSSSPGLFVPVSKYRRGVLS
jgi:hypothetical protein